MTFSLNIITKHRALAMVLIAGGLISINPMVPAGFAANDTLGSAYARHGADDGPNHDLNDDKGGQRDGRHHRDGRNHDKNDDNPGSHHGRDRNHE